MLYRVCLCLDNVRTSSSLIDQLSNEDVYIYQIHSKRNPLQQLGRQSCDMFLVSELLLPEPCEDGIRFLKELPESPSVVLLSENASSETRAAYLGIGCDAVVDAGLPMVKLLIALGGIIESRKSILDELVQVQPALSGPRLSDFVSNSETMRLFMKTVHKVAKSDSSLLILGETGVGKERLARAIHEDSPRGDGPFITINCVALPEALLESELFGHEQGAFTGATRARRGGFELAHKGTIFLDEIGDMPLHLQSKLLRVIQEREFTRIGGEKAVKVDVRIMAATHHNLPQEVEAGLFRSDLYFRLSVVALTIPPLRERKEDINELARSYVSYLNSKIGTSISEISPDTLTALAAYTWPGNVRELINVIERAMLLCENEIITLNDLPSEISGLSTSTPAKRIDYEEQGIIRIVDEDFDLPWNELRTIFLRKLEKQYLAELLRRNSGRIGDTAKKADMSPRALHTKMKQHGLKKEAFKNN